MTDTSKGSYYTMPVDLLGCLGPDTIRNIAYRDDGGLGPEANFPLIFFAIFDDNYKVSVPIGKLMMRGFRNTPDI